MPTIEFCFPDDDDPIFSGAFMVFFPLQSKKSTADHKEAPKTPRKRDGLETPDPSCEPESRR